jgi:hypothetical protein
MARLEDCLPMVPDPKCNLGLDLTGFLLSIAVISIVYFLLPSGANYLFIIIMLVAAFALQPGCAGQLLNTLLCLANVRTAQTQSRQQIPQGGG